MEISQQRQNANHTVFLYNLYGHFPHSGAIMTTDCQKAHSEPLCSVKTSFKIRFLIMQIPKFCLELGSAVVDIHICDVQFINHYIIFNNENKKRTQSILTLAITDKEVQIRLSSLLRAGGECFGYVWFMHVLTLQFWIIPWSNKHRLFFKCSHSDYCITLFKVKIWNLEIKWEWHYDCQVLFAPPLHFRQNKKRC